MNLTLQTSLRRNPVFQVVKNLRDRKVLKRWLRTKSPLPPPYVFKRTVIKEYAQKHSLQTFVETGTYLGDTTAAMKNVFKRIYTVELDPALHEAAVRRFQRQPHIHPLQGDSGVKLPEILREIMERTLFWLDGHYSAGFTAKAELETPILQELDHIFAHPIRDHVILIDDARCFGAEPDYPSVAQLEKHVLDRRPETRIQVKDDIIRIEF
jgi:hypothetical protein